MCLLQKFYIVCCKSEFEGLLNYCNSLDFVFTSEAISRLQLLGNCKAFN